MVVGGTCTPGCSADDYGTPGVIWGDAATGSLSVGWATGDQGVDAMTTPVTDGDDVYVGISADRNTARCSRYTADRGREQ